VVNGKVLVIVIVTRNTTINLQLKSMFCMRSMTRAVCYVLLGGTRPSRLTSTLALSLAELQHRGSGRANLRKETRRDAQGHEGSVFQEPLLRWDQAGFCASVTFWMKYTT
jgi:hypothetical protein